MENDIKAGDLVMVVRPMPCCGNLSWVGRIFKAGVVEQCSYGCSQCGRHSIELTTELSGFSPIGQPYAVEISRLIKIDPPAQPESTETRKEITA